MVFCYSSPRGLKQGPRNDISKKFQSVVDAIGSGTTFKEWLVK